MMIDTGANRLCIAEDVAKELQLKPVDLGKSYGAHGLREHEIFEAHLTVQFSDNSGNQIGVMSSSRVNGVPGLGKHWNPEELQTEDDYPKRLIGLLGRDFLRHAILTYNGNTGLVEVALDLNSLPQREPPRQ